MTKINKDKVKYIEEILETRYSKECIEELEDNWLTIFWYYLGDKNEKKLEIIEKHKPHTYKDLQIKYRVYFDDETDITVSNYEFI